MSIKRYQYIALFFLSFATKIYAQSTYQVGILPAINLNYKFDRGLSLNFKTESRQRIAAGVFGKANKFDYVYVLTDNALIGSKKIGLNSRASVGLLLRFRAGRTFFRTIQQFASTNRLSRMRLSHRFVTDQTFSADIATRYRFRYRVSSEIPLNGYSNDTGEFYLKLGNEYLMGIQNSTEDFEMRFLPILGYFLSEKNKIEIGLDYRLSDIFKTHQQHNFWAVFNWYIDL